MKIYIEVSDHEKLKKNYFHQEYRDYQMRGTCGILVSDTSWYLYVSMHLTGNEYKLVDTTDPNIKKVELTGTIPVAANDPHRQAPRAPLISEVNKRVATDAAKAIRESIRREDIIIDEDQIGEIIVETIKRVDDLLDAGGYEIIHNHVQDEIGW